jgi:hypothetical protein
MKHINSNQLLRMAAAPGCLDDQYVPIPILRRLMEQGLGFREPTIAEERRAAIRREYIRSLLFSPQLVINRAFALNQPELLEPIAQRNGNPLEPEQMNALHRLLREERLVILLNKSKRASGQILEEENLEDLIADPPFPIVGGDAWTEFFKRFGNNDPISYLRLDTTQQEAINKRFARFMKSLPDDSEHTRRMFRQLHALHPKPPIPDIEEATEAFMRFVKSDYVPWCRELELSKINRTGVYQRFINPDDTPASEGFIDTKPFAFEVKLLADAAYNANLPETVNRWCFVPDGMPDPRLLPADIFRGAYKEERPDGAMTAILKSLTDSAREYYYRFQGHCHIPDYANFTVHDVVTIQDWAEWQAFRAVQEKVFTLNSATDLHATIADYHQVIVQLHERMEREARAKRVWRLSDWPCEIGLAALLTVAGLPLTSSALASLAAGIGGAALTKMLMSQRSVVIDLWLTFRPVHRKNEIYREASIIQSGRSVAMTDEVRNQLATYVDMQLGQEGGNTDEQAVAQTANASKEV